jgi:hypothetical protein
LNILRRLIPHGVINLNVLYFSPIYWSDLKQRPQHLAEELAGILGGELTFIEPSISIINGIVKSNTDYKEYEKKINENLHVFRPSGALRLPRSVEIIDMFGFNQFLERKQLENLILKADIIWLGSPIFYNLIKNISNKTIVFDRMDDYEFLTKNFLMKKLLKKMEHQLLINADIVISSSDSLHIDSRKFNKNSYLVKNAVDIDILNTNKKNNVLDDLKDLKKKGFYVFGYIGAIDHWFDFESIREIVEYDEKFVVCLVGRNNLKQNSNSHSRIKYFDVVPKTEIGAVISQFDICLFPFLRNSKKIDTINPVKLYEYLSLNKPILAVKSNETDLLRQQGIYLYDSIQGITEFLDNISEVSPPFNDDTELSDFITNNDWNARAKIVIQILNDEYLVKH